MRSPCTAVHCIMGAPPSSNASAGALLLSVVCLLRLQEYEVIKLRREVNGRLGSLDARVTDLQVRATLPPFSLAWVCIAGVHIPLLPTTEA